MRSRDKKLGLKDTPGKDAVADSIAPDRQSHRHISVRPTHCVRLLAACAARENIDVPRVLNGTQLRQETIDDEHALIHHDQEFLVFENMLRESDDSSFALRAGLRLKISRLGVLGYAIATSATVRDAIAVGLAFVPLTALHCHVQLEESGDEGRLVLESGHLPAPIRSALVDFDMGALFRVMRDVLQSPGSISRIWIEHDQQETSAIYTNAAGCRPSFRRRRSMIGFRRDLLDVRLPLHDHVTHRQALAICERELARYRNLSSVTGKVRALLLPGEQRMPGLEQVADALLMTPRTLRRRLQDEGTTFSAIAEAVKRELAAHWLRETDLALSEISDRLGFCDGGTFSTAFKRWTGKSPSRWRQEMRQTG